MDLRKFLSIFAVAVHDPDLEFICVGRAAGKCDLLPIGRDLRRGQYTEPIGKPVYTSVNKIQFIDLIIILFTKDRKSTRLNSSHGYISYAVFCLKKKKK